MTKKTLFAIPVLAAGMLLVPTGAYAGEITGNGKDTGMREHAKSACGFSGLEDDEGSPLRTQTPHAVWLGPQGPPPDGVAYPPPGTPGKECNPNHAEH